MSATAVAFPPEPSRDSALWSIDWDAFETLAGAGRPDAGSASLPPPSVDDNAAGLLEALVVAIRRDERDRCLREVRALPLGPAGLTSGAYRTGFADALDEIDRRIEQLPLQVGLPAS
jgi:hypothetical protein